MTSLQRKYFGSQDKYFSPECVEALTFESEYLDTKYIQLSDEKSKIIWIELDGDNKETIGFTGLRFTGSPKNIKSISFEIGGQRLDKIYPSITGQFDTISLFNSIVPNTIKHAMKLCVEFINTDTVLNIYYDRVLIKPVDTYEAFYTSTQYCGREDVAKGFGKIKLQYNHPVETLKILASAPLTKICLNLDNQHKVHIPFRGMQNELYLYEVEFNTLLNFSRIDNSFIEFEASEDTFIHPFAKARNIVRFMSGMAGLAFSK